MSREEQERRDKRGKFIDLAERRVNRVIDDIRLVGNLSNRNNYSYTEDDIKKIFGAIEAELKTAKKKFENSEKRQELSFKL